MANIDAPFGAVLVDGEGKQFRVRRFPKKSGNAIYAGDFVMQDSTGTVDVATASSVLLGVAMESKAAASTADIAVCDDPNAIYVIQADEDFAATDIFANANITATAGDSGLSRSLHELDSSTIGTTNTLPLKILGLAAVTPNAYGSYARVKVKINQHAYSSGVLGV